MRSFLTTLCLMLFPVLVNAFTVDFNDLPEPYAVYQVEDITEPAEYLGELNDYPDTYEFTLTEATDVSLSLLAYNDDPSIQFSGILVREEADGSVKDVARLNKGGTWERFTDPDTRLKYRQGPSFHDTLPTGVYRFEVSNPVNVGQYMLRVGGDMHSKGYFADLSTIKAVYQFHGQPVISMLAIPLVYLPLGILVMLVLIYLTMRYRRKQSVDSTSYGV